MSPSYRRPRPSKPSISIVCMALFLGVSSHCIRAQSTPDKIVPIVYVQPLKGARLFQIDHIEGQAVFIQAPGRWGGIESGLRIALFDEKQTLISTVVPGESGRFAMKDVTPGFYTLVVEADKLHTLSIPLQVKATTPYGAPAMPALQLTMRLKTDKRKSVVTPIANRALRAELLERIAKDQAIRNEAIQHGVDHPDKEIQTRWVAIDAENLARLKEIIPQYGWPDPARVGLDGTDAAFILVQHGDLDFQKKMLPLIRRAYRSGKLPGQDYALLLDRVLVSDGKPQIYGTQSLPFDRWQNKEPALFPILDEAHVDQRRAQVGMFPLAEYVKMLKEAYFPPTNAKP